MEAGGGPVDRTDRAVLYTSRAIGTFAFKQNKNLPPGEQLVIHTPDMKIKKLMPMDAESRRLIDWMEKGVYDALQKKYLKTLLFCICEKEGCPIMEEYAWSERGSTTFTPNYSEATADQMRSFACKVMRSLVPLMRTLSLDPMPEEPADYEVPFFKSSRTEAINILNKNLLKMEVGYINSKHLLLALKVKSVLDPCDDKTYQDDDFSNTEMAPSETDCYEVVLNDDNAAHEEELTAQVKEWISTRNIGTSSAFTNVLNKLFFKNPFSSSAYDDVKNIKNFAVISLNGTRVEVAWSVIKGVIKCRLWNMIRGKSADVSPVLGTKRVLYTVSSSGTFHFVLTHEDSVLDIVFDGPQSWLYGVIKEDHSFQFHSSNPYIDLKAAMLLNFTGSYDHLRVDRRPGRIPIGHQALISAFYEILAFKGAPTQEFKTALATMVVHLGEAPKFHKVLLACCKAIIYEDLKTLDCIDKNLGLLVKKWGKFSELGLQALIRAVANEYTLSLDAIVEKIKAKEVPSVQTLRDILDNICLYTHSSWDCPGITIEKNDAKLASAKEHKKNEFCPIDDSDDPYAERIKSYYLRSMGYTSDLQNKKGSYSLKSPDLATDIFERLKSDGLRDAIKVNPAKHQGTPPLYRGSMWGSDIKLPHIGKTFSLEEYKKRHGAHQKRRHAQKFSVEYQKRKAQTLNKPLPYSTLSSMKQRLLSNFTRITKIIK